MVNIGEPWRRIESAMNTDEPRRRDPLITDLLHKFRILKAVGPEEYERILRVLDSVADGLELSGCDAPAEIRRAIAEPLTGGRHAEYLRLRKRTEELQRVQRELAHEPFSRAEHDAQIAALQQHAADLARYRAHLQRDE